jgi:hypothetical protein
MLKKKKNLTTPFLEPSLTAIRWSSHNSANTMTLSNLADAAIQSKHKADCWLKQIAADDQQLTLKM